MAASKFDAERLATLEHHVNSNFFEVQRRLDDLLKFQDRAKENFLEVERRLIDADHKISADVSKASVAVESKATESKLDDVRTKIFETENRLGDVTAHITSAENKIDTVKTHIKTTESKIDDVKTQIVTAESKIDSVKNHLEEKIKAVEDVLMLIELEVVKSKDRPTVISDLAVTPKVPSELDDRLRTLEGKFTTLEKLKLNVPVELIQHEPRLKGIEANIMTLQKNIREEVNKLENMVSDRVPTEQATERFISKMREEMDELRHDLAKAEFLKHEIFAKEKAFASRPELESFETRISKDIVKIQELTNRVATTEKSLDNHFVKIEEKIEGVVKSIKHETQAHLKTFDKSVVDLESKLNDELSEHRRAFDSKLIDMEESVAKVAAETAVSESRKDVESALASHKNEIASLMRRIGAIEHNLESHATAVVSKELAAFSEAIDKKFPDLVTRNDFIEWSRSVAERVRTIETPDMGPLAIRMDELEIKLNEIFSLMREIAVRMPLVIE